MKRYLKNEHIDIFFVYGIAVCLIVVLSIVGALSSHNKKTKSVQVTQKETEDMVFNKDVFSNLSLEGKAYVVYDIRNNEVIASHNGTTTLPLASITKVMTALSATIHKTKAEKVTITKRSIDGSYDLGLRDNQEWSLTELLKYTLQFSSNDGAQAVADAFGGTKAFTDMMNSDAKAFGLNLSFTDPAGLDEGDLIGGMGSALEVAKLFALARKDIPDLLDATTKKRLTVTSGTGKVSGIPNTNQYIELFPGAEGSKTGYTDMAGGNLAIVVDVSVGRPVVFVVLGSTRDGRFRDVEKLYKVLQESKKSN